MANTNATFSFSLVEVGSFPDNTSFTLGGVNSSNVLTAAVFDKETKDPYSIRVLATETSGGSLLLTNTFTITVNNEIETLRANALAEVEVNTKPVATLQSQAGENTSVTYSIVAGYDGALFDASLIGGGDLSFITAPTVLGTEYFVDVLVTGDDDSATDTQLIKVTVVNSASPATIFLFL